MNMYKMNAYFIAPYEEKYLRTCENLERISYCDVVLLGDFDKINSILCKMHMNTNARIIDLKSEDGILNYLKTKDLKTSIIILGCISETFSLKLLQDRMIKSDRTFVPSLNEMFVIDIPKLKHFIFVGNACGNKNYEMIDKRKNMLLLYKFMKKLGVTKANVSLIKSDNRNNDTLEYSLIKMILNDNLNKSINILNPCRVTDLFNINSKYNIFSSNVNVLMFKNSDVTKMFIELLQLFTNYRIGNICEYSGLFFIDGFKAKDEENIIFSILLISKCLKERSSKEKSLVNSIAEDSYPL